MSVAAKLFINGRSQAVRLPKEIRFDGEQGGSPYLRQHPCSAREAGQLDGQLAARLTVRFADASCSTLASKRQLLATTMHIQRHTRGPASASLQRSHQQERAPLCRPRPWR